MFSYWIVGLELQCLYMEVSVNDDAILDSVVSLFCKWFLWSPHKHVAPLDFVFPSTILVLIFSNL